jgi:arginyl-tRNA synthetase
MIPADAGAEITRLLRAAVATGELPGQAGGLSAAGTWRRAPAQASAGPGTYATSLPLAVARMTGRAAEPVAALLAAGLGAVPWVSAARVTGGGYLTVTVTPGRLATLPARIVAAGSAAARSRALAGTRLTAPSLPDPAAAANWEQAWRTQRDALSGRLAEAAGADVLFIDAQRKATRASLPPGHPDQVSAAVVYHGADAVRYALARMSAPRPGAIERQLGRPLDLGNPFVLVRYAHADAASTLRWAAELGLVAGRAASQGSAGGPRPLAPGRAAGQDSVAGRRPLPPDRAFGPDSAPGPGLLPPELALVDAMSWLPERVAAAARRARPAEFAACLERVAGAWLDCNERCPALPFRGSAAPADQDLILVAARLDLAAAARVLLAAGLGILGMSAPARM